MSTVLTRAGWQARSELHYERVHAFAQAARERAGRQEKHPVYDFLTKYYPFSLGKFEKWQPGYGVLLRDGDRERFIEPKYQYEMDGSCSLDPSQLSDKQRQRHQFTLTLLENTQSRQAVYSCFGLHEWAMVYSGADVRHRESAPLRLSQQEIDAVVRSRPLVCTHYDAFRFFSPDAQPLNKLQPGLDDRESLEQPGCIHVNMDLYKWSSKSLPWVGSDLVWECFQLALAAREIDMRASPYDLRAWGYEPICIESDEGKKDYVREQTELERRGKVLRDQLIQDLRVVLG